MGFSPDAPIEFPSQDRLGRKHFSEALGSALRNWRETESLVIGLFGGWGSGKTSIKNLAIHALAKKAKTPPLILNFNPWLISQQEQLIETFFRDIAVALSHRLPGEKKSESSERLLKLADYLSALGTVAHPILDLLSDLGVPAASLGAKVASGLQRGASNTKRVAEAQKDLAKRATKTLSELKAELRADLAKREEPLFVVIDDIDRLTSDEICLLFRLIKANADFPRFIYLILCDRPFVTKALDELAPTRGTEFLEKIVQVSFDIPDPAWDDMVNLAWGEWSTIKKSCPDAVTQSDACRWNALMQRARPYLRHVRAVRRWMNAVRFSFDFFKSRNGFNANPEDLLALELLRVFEPALYERLPSSKPALLRQGWDLASAFDRPDAESKKTARKTELLLAVPEERRKHVDELLRWIFPNSEWSHFGVDSATLLQALRAGDARCFDRYFRFALGKDSLSRSEVKKALAAVSTAEAFISTIQQYIARGRLSLLLDHLEAHANAIRIHAKTIIGALFGIGDTLPSGKWEYGGDGCQGEVVRFILKMLGTIAELTQRESLLIDAVQDAKGIMIPFFISWAETNEQEKNHGGNGWMVSKTRFPDLVKAIVSKLSDLKHTAAIRDAESIGILLSMWSHWGGGNETAAFLREQLKTPHGLWQALRSAACIQISRGMTTYTGVDAAFLKKLAGNAVEAAADRIDVMQCSEEEKLLLQLFRKSEPKA